MPLDKSIKKVLVVGSGPIIIGQSAEFDYSGSQACKALREDGIEVILLNSNPATIQTDTDIADKIYLEPITLEVVETILKKERPDGFLATVGGQTALNLASQMKKHGLFEKYNLRVLGTNVDTIDMAEDRGRFSALLEKIDEPSLKSVAVNNMQEAKTFLEKNGFPLVVRPAFTLGGTGGGIVKNLEQFNNIVERGFELSPINQVLLEKSVAGWGEFEYEVVRDASDNCMIVCNMENIDPMGIHTGESIVIAPSQTLSDEDHQILRNASIKIIRALNVIGSCNIQFSFNQQTKEYNVIEVNPRLSRSSALASKATGYPIARIAAKIAIGYDLPEIINSITQANTAFFEPSLDYVVIKIPRWPFDKISPDHRKIGMQMKSTGEVMAIGRTFEESLLKAIRGMDIKVPLMENESEDVLLKHLTDPTDKRLFAIFELLRRDFPLKRIYHLTKINYWFLEKIYNIIEVEKKIKTQQLDYSLLLKAKKMGFSDETIAKLKQIEESDVRSLRKKMGIIPVYKMVDTCSAEFDAKTPYYYSTYEDENEAEPKQDNDKKKIIIIGSGPIRIGQGIEFDYCCSHASFTLRELGYQSIMINNNPETVSTDFDTSDKLYFEPITLEDVLNIYENEKADGAIVQFGGQTSLNLTKALIENGVKILGTDENGIDLASDRDRFKSLLEKLGIKQPVNGTAVNMQQALEVASRIGYPVIVRPSYVIAGRAMQIVYDEEMLKKYIENAVDVSHKRPVLIDKYIENAIECEVDAACDGEDIYVGGIMEHIEQAGVHSGDANIVYPPITLSKEIQQTILDYTKKIVQGLKAIGSINIQYVVKDNTVYVLEANPRASRTMPYLSKATGVPIIKIATKCMLSYKLSEIPETKLLRHKNIYAVKSIVFPFLKLPNVDIILGPEMKSTGESMGVSNTFELAYLKAILGTGIKIPDKGGILFSLKDVDKQQGAKLAKRYKELGYTIYATYGTKEFFDKFFEGTHLVEKYDLNVENSIKNLIENGTIKLIINTPSKGGRSHTDGFKIRRKSMQMKILCITRMENAKALLQALETKRKVKIDYKDINSY